MKEELTLHELMDNALIALIKERYSERTIDEYRKCFNGIQNYLESKGITYYSEKCGIDYIEHRYAVRLTSLYVDDIYSQSPNKARHNIRACRYLLDCYEAGEVVKKKKMARKPFECPEGFQDCYKAFQQQRAAKHYAPRGEYSLFWSLEHFLLFAKDQGLTTPAHLNCTCILKFLTYYKAYSKKYIYNVVSRMRYFFEFLFTERFVTEDLSKCLPHVHSAQYPFIPSVWARSDVKLLLDTINRKSPQGKRDYAIILLVARLGLRISDVRKLKFSDLNWNRKEVTMIMQKTKQPITLPLLEDIGWAIIDYLKNGRPLTDSECVFIRHRAPYDGFTEFNCMQRMLNRHMTRAWPQNP